MNIILFGPPGAGKGTQARRLKATLGVPHVSSGDALRLLAQQDTPLSHEIHQYMDLGELVPDGLTIDVMFARLDEPDVADGFILDGFPRTVTQAEALDRELAESDRAVDHALYIAVPEPVVIGRLASRAVCPNCAATYNVVTSPPRQDMICDVCGYELTYRTDETPDVVRTRLRTYVRETEPLISYYRRQGKLAEIDGSGEASDVWNLIAAAIGKPSAAPAAHS